MSSNPFAALFNASDEVSLENVSHVNVKNETSEGNNQDHPLKFINEAIEDIFGFTICQNRELPFRNIPLVYLEEFAEDKEHYLTVDLLGPTLFDRLMLENPKEFVIPKNGTTESSFVETEVLIYLFSCYERLRVFKNIEDVREPMKSLIVQNAVLFFQQPIVFPEQSVTDQCIKLMKDFEICIDSFFDDIGNFCNSEGK